ncbi:MAG: hypothetical protein R2698_01900 [Microthrixaceae bacterium]
MVEPRRLVAHRLHDPHPVGDHDDRRSLLAQLVEVVEALALELLVADRDHLVDDEDLGLHVHRHREAQPHVHAAGVHLDRRVDELLDLVARERDDLVELRVDLLAGHAEDRRVEVHVLTARQVGMEPGTQLQQRRDPTTDLHMSLVGLVDAGDATEQCRLARAVVAHQRVHRAALDLEGHVVERPEVRLGTVPVAACEELLERSRPVPLQPEPLGHPVDDDVRIRHGQISSM